MTVATPQNIQFLTLAYFGRPADPASLGGWPATGLSLEAIVLQLVNTAEYRVNTVDPNSVANTGGSRTYNDTNLINTFYQRLFGRLATAVEVSGWTSALARGAVNYNYLGITILQAGLNLPVGTEMRQVLIAKFDSAQLYTGILYNNPVSAAAYSTAAAVLDGIDYNLSTTTTTPQTFAQAQTAVATMVADSGAGGGQTFTLTTSQFNYTGTAGNDTFIGVVDNVTAANSTFNAADNINGAGGVNTLQLTVVNAGPAGQGQFNNLPAALTTNIQNLSVRNVSSADPNQFTNIIAVNAGLFSGLRSFVSDRSISGVNVNNLATGAAVTIVGNGTNPNGNLQFGYGTPADAATLNLTGGTTGGNVEITSAPTTVSVTSSGGFNFIGSLNLSAQQGGSATSLNIAAATNLAIGQGNITGFTGNAAAITVTGAAASIPANVEFAAQAAVRLGQIEANTVKTIDASGLTVGGIQTVLSNNTGIVVTGGQGTDIITTGAVLAGSGAVNAGAGTDRLIVAASAHLASAALGARYTNFEVLQVEDGVEVDLDNIAGITSIALNDGNSNNPPTSVADLSAAQAAAVTLIAGNGQATIGVKGAGNVGSLDSVTVRFDNGNTTANQDINANASEFTLAGVETLNLVAFDQVDVLQSAQTSANLQTITLSGAGTSSIATGNIATANFYLNASASTGATTLNAGQFATNGVRITAGSGASSITGSNQADLIEGGVAVDKVGAGVGIDTVSGGDGSDFIVGGAGRDSLTGGAGADTFAFTTRVTSVAADGSNVDRITDFVAGTDKIGLTTGGGVGNLLDGVTLGNNAAMAALAPALSNNTAVNSIGDVYAQLGVTLDNAAFVASAANGTATVARVVTFTTGSSAGTYAVINNATPGFDGANDIAINISGLTGTLSATDFSFSNNFLA